MEKYVASSGPFSSDCRASNLSHHTIPSSSAPIGISEIPSTMAFTDTTIYLPRGNTHTDIAPLHSRFQIAPEWIIRIFCIFGGLT